MRTIHSQRLEKWLGIDKLEHLQACMANGGSRWYGRPINLVDVPGSVWITRDGDFEGHLREGYGYFGSALDVLKGYWDRLGRVHYGYAAAGFASISDALSRASAGYSQRRAFQKSGPTGVAGVCSTLWRVGAQPSAGSAGGAAPGGTAHTSSDAGALVYTNPSSGTMHLVGADFGASVVGNSLLLYDRLFSVAKTMNSTGTESVTGVPSRYQSTTSTDPDYIGDNFGFIEVGGTALAGTAHNWTTCLYTDQGGNSSTLPSVTGSASAIVDRFDMQAQQWFTPLEAGDVGIKAWTQMQCSALVATGAINFCIGHPLGFMSFPTINMIFPFDWLTNRDQAPRIFDNACIALIEMVKPATTATNYVGRIQMTSAA